MYHYVIHFPDLDLYYSGMRTANKYPPRFDLLKIYQTSSYYVNELLKDGHQCIIDTITEYDDYDALVIFEMKFNQLIKDDPRWINKESRPQGRRR